jgi:hypothetical protein
MKNPSCLVAAPVLAGRKQITALGTKPRLSLVACVILVLAVPVARVQAQGDAPPPNAAASFVSGHLKCVAYYATMSNCLARFSQKDEMRYFNAAAAFLTRARELSGLYGEGPETQEATTRELATVMERSVGNHCENVRKLTDLRPLHDRYNDFCKVVGQKLQGESATIARDVGLSFNEQDGSRPARRSPQRTPGGPPSRLPLESLSGPLRRPSEVMLGAGLRPARSLRANNTRHASRRRVQRARLARISNLRSASADPSFFARSYQVRATAMSETNPWMPSFSSMIGS